eukprot:CAMPEP_0116566696 /NCGR_PEP_ID=MMETSP0397-20121206/14596_1 /TAXON_ID=216820 /ORGANISM="Cyclophora tenuis, Strain ECT3854" /LENGTH=139 /DNA_ID=CAMNT_0004093607 /DNA_START=146 /DNA_END=562 /DNA_ORIENTATION=+
MAGLGLGVGAAVGIGVGPGDGGGEGTAVVPLGMADGTIEGETVGIEVIAMVGEPEGLEDGLPVGDIVCGIGAGVGPAVGIGVGEGVGEALGIEVGAVATLHLITFPIGTLGKLGSNWRVASKRPPILNASEGIHGVNQS